MKPFEKYLKIKEELNGLNYNTEALKQYLHIVQVMSKEEESYKKHRSEMMEWLNTIEKCIYSTVKEEIESL